jgi:hypothetical protein
MFGSSCWALSQPARAIVQKSEALLVTNASLSFFSPEELEVPLSDLLHPAMTAAPSSAAPIQFMIRISYLLKKPAKRLAGCVGICEMW